MRENAFPVDDDRDESEGAFGFFAILACLLVSVGLTALVCVLQMPKYAAPDDFVQALYARGALFNTPGHLMPYSLVAYSAPVCMLYAALPSIPWYPVTLMGLQAVSFAAMLNLARKMNTQVSVRVFALVALGLCELMVTAYLSFSVAALVTFGAGISLILSHGAFSRPIQPRLGDILGYVLIILGVALRYDVCFAGTLVFVPFLIWAIVHNRNLRTFFMALGVVACMLLSYGGGQLAWKNGEGWEEYATIQDAAASVADYPHVDYEDVKRVVPKLSENDVNMIYEFLFVDADTYDLETFQALDGVVDGYGLSTLKEAVTSRVSFTAFVFGLAVLLFLSAWMVAAACGFNWRGHALTLSLPLMVLGLLGLVFLRARPKMHVILPLFAVGLFAIVVAALNDDEDAYSDDPYPHVLAIFPVLGMVAFLGVAGFVEAKYALPLRRSLSSELTGNMQRYVDEHDNQLVAFTLSQGGLMNYDAFEFDKWQHPKNAVFIGGYEYYTTPWKNFLETNELSRDHFLEYLLDDNRMVTVSNEKQAEMIDTYLTEHTGKEIKVEKVESMGKGTQSDDEYFVFKYSYDEPKPAAKNQVPPAAGGIPTTESGRAQAQAQAQAQATRESAQSTTDIDQSDEDLDEE